MASLRITVLSLLFLTASAASSPPPLMSAAAAGGVRGGGGGHAESFSKIYAFGDSYTDTGNTGSRTGPSGYSHVSNPPYGITYFHRPTNRYSDGRLLVDFLAAALSLPYLPPYLSLSSSSSSPHGVNFAVAGSTAIEHDFFVNHNFPLAQTPQSLATQLAWFNHFLNDTNDEKDEKDEGAALFWVGEIGANDYAYTSTTAAASSSVTSSTVQTLAVNRTLDFLEALLRKGATSVVVQGLPMLGCLPLTLYLAPDSDDRDSLGCVATMNRISRTHNARLLSGIRALRRAHPHADLAYADFYAAHRAVLATPAAYGIREPFRTCCGAGGGPYNFDAFATCGAPAAAKPCADPSQYVNWDGVHLTEGMNKVLAELFLRGGYMDPPFTRLISNAKVTL
ncbi:hypothetical protein H6P81_012448 [Aristolochia fimbriata]|uniref:GDSL esterase/lipase n=1 Tax=Aristolochia fimbriata TaxID=158543 RepID=A0AAV7EDZ5_ARIFI|nr:hypothetical protein H6P81_012448 [Aristolochia fimbriata]